LTSLGDLDGDGVNDLAVGAIGDDEGGTNRGAVHVLLLKADGSVKSTVEINSSTSNGPTLTNNDFFGTSLTSLGDLDGDGVNDLAVGASRDDDGGTNRGAVHVLFLGAALADFGDAPDTGAGTGSGNYQTTAADGGPSHAGSAGFGLRLGANVDGDDGTLQNATANADDVAGQDDEDGVLNLLELQGTIGAVPTITLLVNNTTGSEATLSGWIDYNQDGVFDNATERAQATVPTGTIDARVTLTFPAIPSDSAGTTYARFRLSTDAAGQNSTGAASDGEVEDYTFNITTPGSGTPSSTVEINSSTTNGPTLANTDLFGSSLTSLGDLDGDGVNDLAVGADSDDEGGSDRGAVHVLLLNANGSVKQTVEINSSTTDGPTLTNNDRFGSSLTSLGDLDGDGVNDLAVGADSDDEGGSSRGAVHVLLLNANGSVKQTVEINSSTANGPTLGDFDYFGGSVTSLGDLDGDGVNDLAVGARGDDEGGSYRGAVHVLLLNANGSVKQTIEINSSTANGPTLDNNDQFGSSVTSLGDLDGDGVNDLAVGALRDDQGGTNRGAVHVLLLNANGSVKQTVEINSSTPNGPALDDGDLFGSSVTSPGDLDGDGVNDLAVGAYGDDEGGFRRGAVHVLLLNADGSVKSTAEINSSTTNGPTLADSDRFGSSVTSPGDLDGDGVNDLAVGAYGDDEGGSYRGAVHVLFLAPLDTLSPTLTSFTRQTPPGSPTNADSLTFRATFNEDVMNVGAADFSVDSTATATVSGVASVSASVYDVTISGGDLAGFDGTVGLDLGGSQNITDLAGNALPNAEPVTDETFVVDNAAPGVTSFTRQTPLSSVTNADSLTFRATFTKAVASVDTADFAVNGTTTATVSGVAAISASVYDVTISGGDLAGFDGTVGLDLAGSQNITDLAGNALPAGEPVTDETYSVDNTTVPTPGQITLPGSGNYEVLIAGGDVVLRIAGGAEQFRRSIAFVTVLEITGSAGADVITILNSGGAVATPILFTGEGGADLFNASVATGSTTLIGGGGDDTLTGGTVDDFIIGGSGNDVVAGGEGDDRLDGRSGRDTLTGDSGNDTIRGGSGRDEIEGSQDADVLVGGGGPDTISGGDGADRIFGGANKDRLD
jgi:Ca2+-binding RTX toxin-like protein